MGRSGDGKRNNLLGWPKVGAWERLKEYPGQHFAVVGGKLDVMHAAKISATRRVLLTSTRSQRNTRRAWQALLSLFYSIFTLFYFNCEQFWSTISKFEALFTEIEHYLSTFSPYFEHFLMICPAQSGQACVRFIEVSVVCGCPS